MDRKEKMKQYKQSDEYRQYNREYQKKYRLLKKKMGQKNNMLK
jgi:hypothetical protein